MSKIKVLNLYSGIGGNRKLWPDDEIEVTSVEYDEEIAQIYQDYFPNDKVIIGDAHQYLLDHYKEFDFIWASPPCPTHSDIRRCGVHSGQYGVKYPDMRLYEEIILLKHFALLNCKWVIENVKPYYKYLIEPFESGRHAFWSNFYIDKTKLIDKRVHSEIKGNEETYGFDLNNYNINNKRQILRNLVNPKLALFIFKSAFKEKQKNVDDWLK